MREYLFVILVAMATTFLTVPAIRQVAVRWGAFTPVRNRDVHAVRIPRLGGVAILIGYAAGTMVASRLPFLQQVFETRELYGVLGGAALVCLVGAIDDFHELDPFTKLGGQLIAAALVAWGGVQMYSVPLGTVTVLPTPVMVLLTIFLVLLSINAVNFIDGLDGLAAGVVGIAAIAFFVYSYFISYTYNPPNVFTSSTVISAALIGCCLGFLPHNFYPARLFMGDSGALLLGLLLASAMISTTGGVSPSEVSANPILATLLPLAVPLSIILLPLLDVLLAVIRRVSRGQSPFTADKQHLHHRMLQIGHGHRRAVLLLWAWTAVIGLGSVSFVLLETRIAAPAFAVALLAVAALTWHLPRAHVLGSRPKRYRPRR